MNKIHDDTSGDPAPSTAPQKSPTARLRAIPPAFQSIQVNFCKTPGCLNFNVPPREGPIRSGRGASADGYAIVNSGSTVLACRRCKVSTTLKSNQAIYEELQRQGDLIWREVSKRCPNPACASHNKAINCLRKFGQTRAGSQRFQCCDCKTTFSVGKATLRQRQPHKNTTVFDLLINKVAFNRMREIADLSVVGLYGKIDFIYQQCRAFAADRERRLATMAFDRLYLSTDRQDYIVNWPDKKVRKTIQLTAIATADLASGYVLGLSPNYDPAISQNDLETQWRLAGDAVKPAALRDTARLWTLADYDASVRSATPAADADAPEAVADGQQLPKSGCQIHADYLMYGHYQLLRHHFQGAAKLRFFLDAEAGLLAACMGAFADRVKERTADVAIVRIDTR